MAAHATEDPRTDEVLSALMRSASAVLVLGADGGVRCANPAAEAMLADGVSVVGGPAAGVRVPRGRSLEVERLPLGDGTLLIVRDVTAQRVRDTELAAVARVAEAVAAGVEPEGVFPLVAEGVAAVLDVPCGVVWRFDGARAVVVGAHGDHGSQPGVTFPLEGDGSLARVARTGRPARADFAPLGVADPVARRVITQGYSMSVAAPVAVAGRLWGAVLGSGQDGWRAPADAEARLVRFAELAGMAITTAEARHDLERRADHDPLTGLLNREAFSRRAAAHVERDRREHRPVALAVLDIDHFKRINDTFGHAAGDRVLRAVAERLQEGLRADDVLGRIGGEEFAWLLPDTDLDAAVAAAERVRLLVRDVAFPEVGRVTVSVGVAGGDHRASLPALLGSADAALYDAKRAGRDRVRRSAAPPRDRRNLAAIRALARAVDGKRPDTSGHSERVAELAAAIARGLGWDEARVADLRATALVHDVGKVGLPESLLLRPGPLPAEDAARLAGHAELGGRIAGQVLAPEQAAWIRHQHERWDGRGLPDGLAGATIPDGARILAVADAYDVLTHEAGDPLPPAAALARCLRMAGTRFWPPAVAALGRVLAPGDDGGTSQPTTDLSSAR